MGTDRSRTGGQTARDADRTNAHAGVNAPHHAGAAGAFEEGDDVMYVQGVATDVTQTWRRHGWVPPSELPEYQAKWAKAQEPTRLKDMRHG